MDSCIAIECFRERRDRNSSFCEHHSATAEEIGRMKDTLRAADAIIEAFEVARVNDTDTRRAGRIMEAIGFFRDRREFCPSLVA